jgi:MFS family permease
MLSSQDWKFKVRRRYLPYEWLIVFACFGVTLTIGETFWSFGVFFKPLEMDFAWSRTRISSAYTAFLIGYSISVLASGRMSDRYNPRPILIVSAILAGMGISLCSIVNKINHLRIFMFIAGLGSGATWSIPVSVVQRWFNGKKRAGMALAIVTTGVGAGALIFAPFINYLILNYGWRNAYLIVGLIFFLIILFCSMIIRIPPKCGEGSLDGKVFKEVEISLNRDGWTTKKIITNPSYLGIIFSLCVSVLTFQMICVHLIPHATDRGISQTTSAAALGLLGGISILGRLISGHLSNIKGWQNILSISIWGMGISIFWLFFLKAPWMVYSFVFCYGLCHGCRIPANFGIITEFFGINSVGELVGLTSAIAQTVGAFAPYMAGFIFDLTGEYTIAFSLSIFLLMTAGLIIRILPKP